MSNHIKIHAYGVPIRLKHIVFAISVVICISFLLWVVSSELFKEAFPVVCFVVFTIALFFSNRKDAKENLFICVSTDELTVPGVLAKKPIDLIIKKEMIETVRLNYLRGRSGHSTNTSISVLIKSRKPISLSIAVLDPKTLALAIQEQMGIEFTESPGTLNQTILYIMIGLLLVSLVILATNI